MQGAGRVVDPPALRRLVRLGPQLKTVSSSFGVRCRICANELTASRVPALAIGRIEFLFDHVCLLDGLANLEDNERLYRKEDRLYYLGVLLDELEAHS